MIRMIINGALGKMGLAVAEAAALSAGEGEDALVVAAGVDIFASGAKCSYPIFDTLERCDVAADVLVDFSRADALPGVLQYCAARKLPCVIATTGMGPESQKLMDDAARTIPVFQCANMSLGVNLMLGLVRTATLALGGKFDIEIVEAHHGTKLDAPSGTAHMLFRAVQQASGGNMTPVFDRSGRQERRGPHEVGMSAIRGGTVTGTHEVMFLGADETVTITHTAQSRRIFALGSLAAARYVVAQAPGRYAMEDLITEQTMVERLCIERNQAMITLRSIPQRAGFAGLFSGLAAHGVNIDMISQTAPRDGKVDISFTLPMAALATAREALTGEDFDVRENLVKLAVEGSGMARKPGVAARMFDLLAGEGTLPLLVTTSESKIEVCLNADEEEPAGQALMEAFHLRGAIVL